MVKSRSTGPRAGYRKPRISLTADDHERLSDLAQAAHDTQPDVAEALMEELDRAHVLANGRCPDNVVRMGAEVEFRDETTAKVQRVTLVYPHEADIGIGKVSVLTPIGVALVGLSVGQSIDWKTRTGDRRHLTVLRVQVPAPA